MTTVPEQVPGSRARRRTSPIRRRIAVLLAIPLVSLTVLWAYSATTALSAAAQRSDFDTLYNKFAFPIGTLVLGVQDERAAAVTALAAPTSRNGKRFHDKETTTDTSVVGLRQAAGASDVKNAMKSPVAQHLELLYTALENLKSLRARVDARQLTPIQAIDGYSEIIDSTDRLQSTLVIVDDVSVYQNTTSLLFFYWANDFVLRQDVLLSTVKPGSKLNAVDRAAFARYAGTREEFFDLGRTGVNGKISAVVEQMAGSPAYTTYRTLEQGVLRDGKAPRQQEWRAAIAAVSPVWVNAARQAGVVMNKTLVAPVRESILLRFYLAGGLGLLAVAASLVLSLLFARRLTRELSVLQKSAQALAHEHLPRVVARLRGGETVDVEAEAPRPQTGKTREIALVAEAFSVVQRTAVSTAIAEADLRRSISSVFVNLSWRSQSLLHRQLRLLDQMERRASSPDELDDLFRLDHLTTRMRRHAEGLVILSGSPTVRAWDQPVAVEDLVNAAIAEVEDYTRVEVTGVSSAAVSGNVVADVIHLLAELIENAAAFSPPATEVTVKVETVANGLAVEVVDRGVGLYPDEMADLNKRLSDAVEFDLVDTERLGLFVVARLAARHNIKVSLHPSPYGGTTAIVLVPNTLVASDPDPRAVSNPYADRARPVIERARPAMDRSRAVDRTSPVMERTRPVADRTPSVPAMPGAVKRLDHPPMPALSGPPAASYSPQPPADRGMGMRLEPSPASPGETENSEITGRLPRRQKQGHMAPQLRDRPVPPRHATPDFDDDDDFDEPSPELSRNLMSSLQSGWLRGRESDPNDNDPYDEMGRS
jgi:signal transduction histidine kinase